jgi:O-antigen ligase
VYWLTLGSITDRPMLGHGYGTFVDIFPMYRDRSISVEGFWEQAHNTYLEIFQGLGLVFGSMLLASVLLLVWRCVQGAMTRRENATMPRVAAAAAALVGIHSLVDFSLQIQAVALTFAAMLGAGVAQAKSSRVALQD